MYCITLGLIPCPSTSVLQDLLSVFPLSPSHPQFLIYNNHSATMRLTFSFHVWVKTYIFLSVSLLISLNVLSPTYTHFAEIIEFYYFYVGIMSRFVYIPHLLCPFMRWYASRFILGLDHYRYGCNDHGSPDPSRIWFFSQFMGYRLKKLERFF